MLLPRSSVLSGALLTLCAMAAPLSAQNGTLTGRVVDTETRQPVATALVDVQGPQSANQVVDAAGQFRFSLPEGTYTVVVGRVGYQPARFDGVSITSGQNTELAVVLSSQALLLNPITVTSTPGRPTKAVDAPSSTTVIGPEIIRERPALTAAEHLRAVPGVDIAQTGLTQSNIVARGFNNVFSGSLLAITDNRYAHVPSLRVNVMNFIPTNDADLDRIEVVLGPGAALYGPNAASGVLHMITSSPLDRQGNTVSVAGGERSVFQTTFRTALAPSESFGFKISGQYFQGRDWEYRDPAEEAARQANPGNPLIGNRDFDARRWGGEARLDFRPTQDSELIFNAGLNNSVSSIELTGIGAGQSDNWKYSYLQGRYRNGRLFMQSFLNQSDAGDTYLLRTGQSIVDKSRMMAAQVQHGFDLGERQEFTYGVDLQRTEPRTEGTITGRNEDDDIINEVGAYLHSTTGLTDRIDLVAALRVDDHDRLEDLNFSPRVAIAFRPAPDQNFRVTFNRAFSTPSTNNLFLDLVAGRIPIAGDIGYDVRTLGVPVGGFTFDDRCDGGVQGLCMRTPFAAGQLPANGLPLWNGLVNQLVPAQLRPALLNPGAAPGDPAIASLLRRFDQEGAATGTPFVPDAGPENIGSIRSTITNTFEVGYKGIIADKLLLSADLYSTRVNDFVGPLRVETPTVFYDPASVQAFVLARLGPLIQGGLVTQQQAAQIIQGLASVPLGTVAPDQNATPDLILTYRNFGDVDFWGADLAAQFLAGERLSLRGSYSFVSEDCFLFSGSGAAGEDVCSSALDIALNAPKNKGSVSVRFDDVRRGFSTEGRVRFTSGFPMNSGVFVGRVEGYTVFDGSVNYRIPPVPGASVSLAATNLFNTSHRQFIGAPELGRLLLLRLQYDF
jgi:outer membrane receptor for ferrienterochelin and colicins